MCNDIIGRAVSLGAGDVCIDRRLQGGTIRFRVGGVFQSMPTLPGAVSQPIADRFKIMARVGVAVRHRPQEGTFQVPVNGRPIVVRLSTQPILDGEEIMMQMVDSHERLRCHAPVARADSSAGPAPRPGRRR